MMPHAVAVAIIALTVLFALVAIGTFVFHFLIRRNYVAFALVTCMGIWSSFAADAVAPHFYYSVQYAAGNLQATAGNLQPVSTIDTSLLMICIAIFTVLCLCSVIAERAGLTPVR